jgi:hypothetical protein
MGMTHQKNNNIPPTPSVVEAASMANVLDNIGAYEDAELIDEYIEKITTAELSKHAGIWENVWERTKGRTKRIFLKEFREAHNAAKSVQEKLHKRIRGINQKYKNVSRLLKTYQLADWYNNLRDFEEVGGDSLLSESDFQKDYGRFMKSILKVKEEAPSEEEKSEEKKEVEKVFGPGEKTPEEIGEWNVLHDKQRAGVQQHFEDGRVRIRLNLWNRWARTRQFMRVSDPENEGRTIIRVNTKAAGRLPENLQAAMEDDLWRVLPTDAKDGYIYLERVATGQSRGETDETPEVGPADRAFEKKPKIPTISPTPIPKVPPTVPKKPESEEVELGEEDIEEAPPPEEAGKTLPPIPEKGKVPPPIPSTEEEKIYESEELGMEEIKEDEKGRAEVEELTQKEKEEGEMTGAPEGTTWIRYKPKSRYPGKFYPVKTINPKIHQIVEDEQLIEKLNKGWVDVHSGKPIAMEAKDIATYASRKDRINKILQLSE